MEAAEEIMGADTEDHEAYQATTMDAVMRIFEACSFQDITGQRISKVVQTLAHIEERVMELRNLMGITAEDIQVAMDEDQPQGDAALLSGPALDGEGIDQNAVDQLMGGGAPAEPAAAPETSAAAPVSAPAPAAQPTPAAQPAPVAQPAPKPQPKPQPKPEPPKAVNPAQLDAMFAEDFDPVADLEAKKKAEESAKEKEAAKVENKVEKEVKLGGGEEVSQDDIDALFG